MATVAYKSQELAALAGTFTGGLGGAPNFMRSTDKGKYRVADFHFQQGVSAGNIGDTIDLAYLPPTAKVYFIVFTNGAGGTSCALNIGIVDPNNSANNNATLFANAQSIAAASTGPVLANGTGAGIQVGADPQGDESTGNQAPNYGSSPVTVQASISGAGLAANTVIKGFIGYNDGM